MLATIMIYVGFTLSIMILLAAINKKYDSTRRNKVENIFLMYLEVQGQGSTRMN